VENFLRRKVLKAKTLGTVSKKRWTRHEGLGGRRKGGNWGQKNLGGSKGNPQRDNKNGREGQGLEKGNQVVEV